MYDGTDSCMMEYIFWIKLSYQMNSERYLKQKQKQKNNKKIVIIYAWPQYDKLRWFCLMVFIIHFVINVCIEIQIGFVKTF